MEGRIINHQVDLFQLLPVEGTVVCSAILLRRDWSDHGHHFQHLFRGETDTGRKGPFQKFGGEGTVLKSSSSAISHTSSAEP